MLLLHKNDKLKCLNPGSLQGPEPGIDHSGGTLLLAKCCGRRVFNAFQDATRWPVAVVQLCQHLEHIQADNLCDHPGPAPGALSSSSGSMEPPRRGEGKLT